MATAVLDLHLEKLPAEIKGLEAYSKAFILLRYKSKPIGKLVLPVTNGCLSLENFYKKINDAGGAELWNAWLQDYLDIDGNKTTDYKPPLATIAICTRDRPADLQKCLDGLMMLPDDGQEILVIDNSPSTNATRDLVEKYTRVRYILENNPGLNWARNRALIEAKNEVVAFTDDDAVPDPDWLRQLLKNFDHPLVACVTGITMPLELETAAQEAFEKYNSFSKGFKRKVHSSISRNPLATGEVGAGANMAIRKSMIKKVGFFDEALDAGTFTQSGGDHEYFARILLAGFQIVYEPGALNWHRHRREWRDVRKAIKGYGIGVYAFWTRCLVVEKEFGILKFPFNWLVHVQIPNLIKALLRTHNHQPISLIIAELMGCAQGPWAYLRSRMQLKHKQNS